MSTVSMRFWSFPEIAFIKRERDNWYSMKVTLSNKWIDVGMNNKETNSWKMYVSSNGLFNVKLILRFTAEIWVVWSSKKSFDEKLVLNVLIYDFSLVKMFIIVQKMLC